MRAYKQLVNGEYVVPNLKCYLFYLSINDFPQGLAITATKNFGGGNTAWEEEKLAKYARR